MTTLETDGVVVFKVLSLEELAVHRAALLAAAMAAPELKAAATVDTLPVLGAFGAHGYPSTFICSYVTSNVARYDLFCV